MPALGKFPVEYNVSVQNTAYRIGNRLVHVVAVNKYGIKSGNRTFCRSSAPLEQFRQYLKDARSVAAGCRRFPNCEADFTLSLGKAGNRIEKEHHILSLVAEIFGDCSGRICAADTGERAGIRCSGYHNRMFESFRAEVVFQEIVYLAAAFADECNHVNVGARVPRNHTHQG